MKEVHHAIHEHYMTHFLCLTHAQSNVHQLLVKSKVNVNVCVNVDGAVNCFKYYPKKINFLLREHNRIQTGHFFWCDTGKSLKNVSFTSSHKARTPGKVRQ